MYSKYQPLLKFIGKEIVLMNKRYRILGVYDDTFSLYFVCYDGSNDYFTLNAFFYYGNFYDTDELVNIATPEKCVEIMKAEESSLDIFIEDGIIYAKVVYADNGYLGIIHYKDKEIKLDMDVIKTYDGKTGDYKYDEPMFDIHITDKNYINFVRNIKKAYFDIEQKYINNKLTPKQSRAFEEIFVYEGTLKKEKV